jgi:hypothetical protein
MTMAALAGVGAALAVLSTPIGLIEMIVASTGLSEVVAAAAPPLGYTARLLMGGFAALMAIGVVWAMGKDNPILNGHAPAVDSSHGDTEMTGGRGQRAVNGEKKMGFALSRLTAMARGRSIRSSGSDMPVLRRADAHPDAPARAPIFASRDFDGLDIFARTEPGKRELVVAAEPESDPVVAGTGLDMPSAPAPFSEADLPLAPPVAGAVAEPLSVPCFVPRAMPAPAMPSVAPAPWAAATVAPPAQNPIMGLSISELTERLERGLALRDAQAPNGPAPVAQAANTNPIIADMPVAPPVAVRDSVEVDVDEALRAALGTLRTMTARSR